jgi:hypothetical protein
MKRWIASVFVLLSLPGFLPSAVAQTQASAKPEILLVYWGSRDCRWCTYWESSLSGMEASLKNSEEFKKITYRVVKNARLEDPYTDEDYPADMKWLKERVDRGQEKNPGRPGWLFFVDKVCVAKFYGTRGWTAKILPEIKSLVAKYSAAAQPIVSGDSSR